MTTPLPFVVTISRQFGSGGAHIGRQLATELGITYADRDILERAAAAFDARVEDLAARDEAAPSLLERLLESYSLGSNSFSVTPFQVPSYGELREVESAVIREIAARRSAVIVGHAGFHSLASHPRHLSVFVHADLRFRAQKIEEIYGCSHKQALRQIEESDSARGRYLHEITGRPWTDALQYTVSLCTSAFGVELAGRVLCDLVKARFHL